MTVEDAVRELTEVVKGKQEGEAGGGGGLTLYGPYYATTPQSKTMARGTCQSVTLPDMFDGVTGTSVDLPSVPCKTFITGTFGFTDRHDIIPINFNSPIYSDGQMVGAWMCVSNVGNTYDITMDAESFGLIFYSDTEFPTTSET